MTTVNKQMDIVIENPNYQAVLQYLQYDHKFNGNIDADLYNLQLAACRFNVKIGRGGSHIWVSNTENERIAMITY